MINGYEELLKNLISMRGTKLLKTVTNNFCQNYQFYIDRPVGCNFKYEQYEYTDYIRVEDSLNSPYIMGAVHEISKGIDNYIFSKSLDELPSHQKIIYDDGNLLDKLITARYKMDSNNINDEQFVIINLEQLRTLYNSVPPESDAFYSIRLLNTGKIDKFLGFTFVIVSSKDIPQSVKSCMVWSKSDMVVNFKNVQTKFLGFDKTSNSIKMRTLLVVGIHKMNDNNKIIQIKEY